MTNADRRTVADLLADLLADLAKGRVSMGTEPVALAFAAKPVAALQAAIDTLTAIGTDNDCGYYELALRAGDRAARRAGGDAKAVGLIRQLLAAISRAGDRPTETCAALLTLAAA